MASPTISAPTRPTVFAASTGRTSATYSRGARISPASRVATRAPRVTATSTPVRLTRRGRVTAFVASLAALLAVVVGAGQMADASNEASTVQSSSVVVQSGETLWGIAKDVAPGHDPRMVISQIRDLNDLGTRSIVPGQTLVVPTLG